MFAITKTYRTQLLALGFCLHTAWVCSAMYSRTFIDARLGISGIFDGTVSIVYLVSVITVSVVSFLAALVLDGKATAYSRSRKMMLAAAVLCSLGTLLLVIPPSQSMMGYAIDVLSGVTTGLGSTVLCLYWGIGFSRLREGSIVNIGPGCIVVGYALSVLVIQNMPQTLSVVFVALLPILEYALLDAVTPHPGDKPLNPFRDLKNDRASFGRALFQSSLFGGLALGLLKQESVRAAFDGASSLTAAIVLGNAGLVVVAAFSIYPLVHKNGDSWGRLYKNVVLWFAGAALIASLLVSEYRILTDMFLVTSYFLLEALLWTVPAFISSRLQLSPLFVFGITRGVITCSMFASSVATAYLDPLFASSTVKSLVVVVVLCAFIALCRAALPKDSDLARIVIKCPPMRLALFKMEELYGEHGKDANLSFATKCVGDEGPKPEGVSTGLKEDGLTASEDGPETCENAPLGSESLSPAVSETAIDAPAISGAAPIECVNVPFGKPTEAHDKEGKFTRRVKRLAQLYMLTSRETDILFELAKGRPITYIQEKCFISAGTVKTHVRNIYHKLDIHKRGDLIALLESMDDLD